ncbi:alpha/beta hydrolase, partial [Streptomyces sp. UNOC14_S4]|nr:alpha/beta hydrolase [Streptomyces sp. UNOC14_S4]
MPATPLDPGIAALLDQAAASAAVRIRTADPATLRETQGALAAMMTPPEPIPVRDVREGTVPGPGGEVPVRVYRPDAPGPLPT